MKKGTNAKNQIRNSIGRKLIVGWCISLFIPLLIINTILFHKSPLPIRRIINGANQEDRYIPKYVERIVRDIDIWANEDPDSKNSYDDLRDLLSIYDEGMLNKLCYVVLVSDDTYRQVFPYNVDDSKSRVENDRSISIPGYGVAVSEDKIKELKKENIVIYSKIDVKYRDGNVGSVYTILQYPSTGFFLVRMLGENLIMFIIFMLIVHSTLVFIFIKTFTVPLNNLLNAIKKYKKQDFGIRLDENIKDPMFATINQAINDMADDLQESQEKSKQLEEYRLEFLANISHDTKTPLSSIRIHAEALRDGVIHDDNKKEKYLNNILKKTQSIDNIINELSIFSSLEKGIGKYDFVSVDINYYILDMIDEFKYDYNDYLILNYEPPKQKNAMVRIDIEKLKRVFMNIIKNSVWYGGKEPITIDINLSITEQDAIISIRDNGMGVEKESLDKIFDSFVRGDTSRNPNQAGSGLGLAIAKRIVLEHNGSIQAKSEIDEYFEIVITLPLERSYIDEKGSNNRG